MTDFDARLAKLGEHLCKDTVEPFAKLCGFAKRFSPENQPGIVGKSLLHDCELSDPELQNLRMDVGIS